MVRDDILVESLLKFLFDLLFWFFQDYVLILAWSRTGLLFLFYEGYRRLEELGIGGKD
jgi:hypothetical protein